MKNLSLFTFALFLVLLGVRLFSIQSDRFDKIGNIENDKKEKVSVFEMEPEKAKALLDDLDLYVKRSKEQERKVAQEKDKQEGSDKSDVDMVSVKASIDKKYRELDEAFLAQENNILDIKYMQDEIKRIKKEANIEFANSEIWSAEFILMLMMQEQFTLREINELNGPEDLGIEMEEWVEMKEVAQSNEFKNKIKAFKGIAQEEVNTEEITDFNIEDVEKEEVADPYESKDRNEAISKFMERNSKARQGENNDLIAVEPDEYSGSEEYKDPYAQETEEPVRLPATLQEEDYQDEKATEGNTEEQEYQNYNDGYEDEY